MAYFIVILRALSSCLITNAHYIGIYPTDLLANGGLLGDVIFFAVSGYCLGNVKKNFLEWYKKRILRIYPSVLIVTITYLLLGFYTLEEHNILYYFLYPTYYHFIASIIILYIPYYLVAKIDNHKMTRIALIVVGIIWSITYIFVYDKSYYHIDTVREPMIRFLFFVSMLIGLYFRQIKIIQKSGVLKWITMFGLVIIYFCSKILFVRNNGIATFQILNQWILVALLIVLFYCFNSIEFKCRTMNNTRFFQVISYISQHTLEIYLVQYVIIPICAENFGFPINWFMCTFAILVSATLVRFIVKKFILKKRIKG